MFPSAVNISNASTKKSQDNDAWLTNQSFQVPIETLSDDDGSKDNKDDNDVEIIAEKGLESKRPGKHEKKKKKKRSRELERDESPSSRSRSRSRGKSSRSRDDSPRHRRQRSKERSKNKNHHKSRKEERETIKPPSKASVSEKATATLSSKKVFLEETGLPPEKAYREDFKPDPNNLAFTSIYNLLVPTYDKKKCFKTAKIRTILRNVKKDKASDRYFDNELAKDEDIENISIPSGVVEKLPEYLPISASAHKVVSRDFGDRMKDIYDPTTVLYIQGKAPQTSEDSAVGVESSRPFALTVEMQDKTKEFNEYLRTHPHDIDRWFKFLQFQEDSFIWQASETCQKSREVVLAEKKLSIIDKAIELNPKCMKMILERLNIMKFTATAEELDKEWKKLTFHHPNNPLIWKNYFIFLQTHITYFSVTKLVKAFHKCLEIFNHMLEGSFATHKPPPNLEMEILNTIFHYATFLSQSGYREKSIAIWQALIEFNMFTPDHLVIGMPLPEWIALLEPFWDSGCSRFGEKGAIGWNQVMKTKSLIQGPGRPPIDDLEDPILEQYSDHGEIWFKIEALRDKYYWFPVKGTEAEEADDIERNVVFDDITQVLFRFRREETKFQLLLYFLKFLGAMDSSDMLENQFITDDRQILNPIPSYFNLSSGPDYVDYVDFQDQVYQQSINFFQDDQQKQLIMSRIKFLINNAGQTMEYKVVKKIIKDYLKVEKNRNDLDLWQLLTNLEVKRGDNKEAQTIFETAITLFIGRINSRRLLKFVRSYCHFLLAIKDLHLMDLSYKGLDLKSSQDIVLQTITSVVNGRKCDLLSPTLLLRCLKTLSTMIQVEDEFTCDLFFCQVLVNFISNDTDSAYTQCENELKRAKSDNYKEEIWTIYLQLHVLDLNRNFKPLSKLRNSIHRALKRFPSNKSFLSLFIEVESKVAIPVAVNRFFTDALRQTNSNNLVLWIFYIHIELKRLNIMKGANEAVQCCDGIVRRITSLFERCLSFPHNQETIVLWRMYIKFALDHGMKQKAESLLYRALQHCPSSKLVYMDAIEMFPGLSKDMIGIMIEKEIRLRTPLEEIDLLKQAKA